MLWARNLPTGANTTPKSSNYSAKRALYVFCSPLLAKDTAKALLLEAAATLEAADCPLQEYIVLPLFPVHTFSTPKATLLRQKKRSAKR